MKLFIRITVVALSLLNTGLALAYDYSPADVSQENAMARSGRKLGRGVSNLFLGWVEVPRGIEAVGQESGFAAAGTWGVLQGAGSAVLRTAAGALEIVTFPFPVPSKDSDPLVEPEYIL